MEKKKMFSFTLILSLILSMTAVAQTRHSKLDAQISSIMRRNRREQELKKRRHTTNRFKINTMSRPKIVDPMLVTTSQRQSCASSKSRNAHPCSYKRNRRNRR